MPGFVDNCVVVLFLYGVAQGLTVVFGHVLCFKEGFNLRFCRLLVKHPSMDSVRGPTKKVGSGS